MCSTGVYTLRFMKLYITTIALITGMYLSADAQKEVKLSLKFQPQRHYLSKFNINVSGTVNAQGNNAVADSLKAKGLAQNSNLKLVASGDVDVTTGAESAGMVPVTMKVDNITAKPSINGQQIPFVPVNMLNGKMVYAKASDNGQLHIDSVSGKQLPDSALNHINNMMNMAMSRMQFPDKTFKPGDTFTQDIPFNMPMKGMPPVNATTKVTYHLVKITGDKAYFNITQNTHYMDNKHNMNTVFTGTGTGSMVYEIKERYPSAFQSDMQVNLRSTGNGKGSTYAMFTIVTNGTTSLGS